MSLSVCPSVHLSVCLSVCCSVRPSACASVRSKSSRLTRNSNFISKDCQSRRWQFGLNRGYVVEKEAVKKAVTNGSIGLDIRHLYQKAKLSTTRWLCDKRSRWTFIASFSCRFITRNDSSNETRLP